ncbi:FCD domain-containing protein [Paracoccus suum]|nr:FCD domain-containing protein [Paracoccus suum]
MNDAKSFGSVERWDADQELHTAIAHASGNGLFERMVAECRLRTGMFGMERIPSRFESGRAEHLATLGALHERAAEAVGPLMDAHIENAKLAVVRALTGLADL